MGWGVVGVGAAAGSTVGPACHQVARSGFMGEILSDPGEGWLCSLPPR